MYALSNARRIIGSIIVCASQDIGMLIVGRIINGLAVGVSSSNLARGLVTNGSIDMLRSSPGVYF